MGAGDGALGPMPSCFFSGFEAFGYDTRAPSNLVFTLES